MENLSVFTHSGYDGTHVLVTRTAIVKGEEKVVYRCKFLAATEAAASAKVAELNRDIRKAELADHRYNVEVAGIQIGDLTVHTDREAQASIANAVASLEKEFFVSTPWKGMDGWTEVSIEQILPIAQIVSTHVRECFVAEKAVSDQLDSIVDHVEMLNFNVVEAFNALYNPYMSEEIEDPEVPEE